LTDKVGIINRRKSIFSPVIWSSNPYCPTLFMPTGEKVKFYRYFGVQIPSPALIFIFNKKEIR
jgi:hypothetical protein